jgi:acyl transferase domain-containing protein/acyl carrier protein/pimeloyl-ACP methyl ester carboxylesterase
MATGDVAQFDQRGYLHVVDRLKDMMLVGGENVYSAEIESTLKNSPLIAEVAAFGLPHELLGETVAVAVVQAKDADVEGSELEREIIALAVRELGEHKAPSHCFFVSNLPKSTSGKVLKRRIRSYFEARSTTSNRELTRPCDSLLVARPRDSLPACYHRDADSAVRLPEGKAEALSSNALAVLGASVRENESIAEITLSLETIMKRIANDEAAFVTVALEHVLKWCTSWRSGIMRANMHCYSKSFGTTGSLMQSTLAFVEWISVLFGASCCSCVSGLNEYESLQPLPVEACIPSTSKQSSATVALLGCSTSIAAAVVARCSTESLLVFSMTTDEDTMSTLRSAALASSAMSIDLVKCNDLSDMITFASEWNTELGSLVLVFNPDFCPELRTLSDAKKLASMHQHSSVITEKRSGFTLGQVCNACMLQIASADDAALHYVWNLPELHSLLDTHRLLDGEREELAMLVSAESNEVNTNVLDKTNPDVTDRHPQPSPSVRDILERIFQEVTGFIMPEDDTQPLWSAGLTSLAAVNLTNRLQEALACELPPTILFDYPHAPELIAKLEEAMSSVAVAPSAVSGFSDDARLPFAATNANERRRPSATSVLGISTVGPGSETSDDRIGQIDLKRWDTERAVDRYRWAPPLVLRAGGVINDAEFFDFEAFRMSRRDAESADPQQRLLLLRALECSRRDRTVHKGQEQQHNPFGVTCESNMQTGVFVGVSQIESACMSASPDDFSSYAAIGAHLSVNAGRLSYTFGLHGEACVIDTACSSALVAVANALRSDCTHCLAGGVNLTLVPSWTLKCASAGMLSPDARCKTLDASADGYARSEASGMLLLDLKGTVSEGESIAYVLAAHSNQDGSSGSITSPRGPAQYSLMQQAMQKAGVGPESLDLVELHGTGTSLGDPIELQALAQSLSSRKESYPALSAGKSSVGHAEPAAGMLGITNALEQLSATRIAPVLHWRNINSNIRASGSFGLPKTQPAPLPASTGIGVVSGMAFQGTNACIILSTKRNMSGNEQLPNTATKRASLQPERIWPEPRFHSCLQGVIADAQADMKLRMRFNVTLRANFFRDHVVGSRVLLPASAALDFVIDSVRRFVDLHDRATVSLEQVTFSRAIQLSHKASESQAIEVEIAARSGHFSLFSPDGVLSVEGHVARLYSSTEASRLSVSPEDSAECMVLARSEIRDRNQLRACSVQPTVFDAALQSLHATSSPQLLVPISLKAFHFSSELFGRYALMLSSRTGESSNHTIIDENSAQVLCIAREIRTRQLNQRPVCGNRSERSDNGHTMAGTKAHNSPAEVIERSWLASATESNAKTSCSCNWLEPHHQTVGRPPRTLTLTLAALEAITCSRPMNGQQCIASSLHSGQRDQPLDAALRVARLENAVSPHDGVEYSSDGMPSAINVWPHETHERNRIRFVHGVSRVPCLLRSSCGGTLRGVQQPQAKVRSVSRSHILLGGNGGIGMTYAKRLLSHDSERARRITLTGRSADQRIPMTLAASSRAVVTLVTCDSAAARGRLVVDTLLQRDIIRLPLSIVALHGVTRDASVPAISARSCREVVGSKSMDLPAFLSSRVPLKNVIAFSSVVSDFGNRGQLSYATANAAVDASSAVLRNAGIPAVSVQWGAWRDIGMASKRPEALRTAESTGLGTLTTEQAMSSIPKALLASRSSVIVSNLSSIEEPKPKHHRPEKAATPQMNSDITPAAASVPLHNEMAIEEKVAVAPRGDSPHESSQSSLTGMSSGSVSAGCNALIGSIQATVEQRLGVRIEPDEPFMDAGLDSLGVMDIHQAIEQQTSVNIPPTAAFDYPTPTALAEHVQSKLWNDTSETSYPVSPTTQKLTKLMSEESSSDGVAISAASRFDPGVESAVHDMLSRVRVERWDVERLFSVPLKEKGARFGSFMHRVERFDADLFRLGSSEAKQLDPQQRLLLENAAECVHPVLSRPNSETGVFVGVAQFEYSMSWSEATAFVNSGNALSVASGRIAFVFGLMGVCASIDTACSSSLMAVHYAKQEARRGKQALAGGVSLTLSERKAESFNRAGMLSEDGRCKALDASADGYTRGEFSGFVLLGVSDSDVPGALLVGSAANQDGRSTALTAPSGPRQQQVIGDALADAGEPANMITAFELHGTGTALGDPIEASAANTILRPTDGDGTHPVAAAAGKTQMGHTEPAAGIVGLVRGCLSKLQMRTRSPVLHLRQVSPYIESSCVKGALVPSRQVALRASESPNEVGAVTSFAFQGSNCHLLVKRDARVPSKSGSTARTMNVQRQRMSMIVSRYSMLLSVRAASTQRIRFVVDLSLVNSSLQDHVIAEQAILPATGMLESFYAALKTTDAPPSALLRSCVFMRPVSLSSRVDLELSVSSGTMHLSADGNTCARAQISLGPLQDGFAGPSSPAADALVDVVPHERQPLALGAPVRDSNREIYALGPGPAACDNLLQLAASLSGNMVEMRVPTSVEAVSASFDTFGSKLMAAVRMRKSGTVRALSDHLLVHNGSTSTTRCMGLETRLMGQPRRTMQIPTAVDSFLYSETWKALASADINKRTKPQEMLRVESCTTAERALMSASILQANSASNVEVHGSYHEPAGAVSKVQAAESTSLDTDEDPPSDHKQLRLVEHSRKVLDEAASFWCLKEGSLRFSVVQLRGVSLRTSRLSPKGSSRSPLSSVAHIVGTLEAAPKGASVRASGATVAAWATIMRDGRRAAADPELVVEIPRASCNEDFAVLLEPACDAVLASRALCTQTGKEDEVRLVVHCERSQQCLRARVTSDLIHRSCGWPTQIVEADLPDSASHVLLCCCSNPEDVLSRCSHSVASFEWVSSLSCTAEEQAKRYSQLVCGVKAANATRSTLAGAMQVAASLIPTLNVSYSTVKGERKSAHRICTQQPIMTRSLSLKASYSDQQGRLAIITGGTGQLGLLIALWESARGSDVVLQSRTGRIDRSAGPLLSKLLRSCVQVSIVRSDIARAADWQALQDHVHGTSKRVIVHHAAGVLRDGFVRSQSSAGFQQVATPKAGGAAQMQTFLSCITPIDGFLSYATAGSVVGNAGQSNYVAANSAIERFAITKRGQGVPSAAVQWGAWSGGGMANENALKLLRRGGWDVVMPERGLSVIEGVLNGLQGARKRSVCSTLLEAPVSWSTFVRKANFVPRAVKSMVPKGPSSTESKGEQREEQRHENEAKELETEAKKKKQKQKQKRRMTEEQRNSDEGRSSKDERDPKSDSRHTASSTGTMSRENVKAMVQSEVDSAAGRHVREDEMLMEAGLDSLAASELRDRFAVVFQMDLDPTFAFDYPDIASLSDFLYEHQPEQAQSSETSTEVIADKKTSAGESSATENESESMSESEAESDEEDGNADANQMDVSDESGAIANGAERGKTKDELMSNVKSLVDDAAGRNVDPSETLMETGIDSLSASELRDSLVERTGVELDPTFAFDLPDMNALVDYLFENQPEPPHQQDAVLKQTRHSPKGNTSKRSSEKRPNRMHKKKRRSQEGSGDQGKMEKEKAGTESREIHSQTMTSPASSGQSGPSSLVKVQKGNHDSETPIVYVAPTFPDAAAQYPPFISSLDASSKAYFAERNLRNGFSTVHELARTHAEDMRYLSNDFFVTGDSMGGTIATEIAATYAQQQGARIKGLFVFDSYLPLQFPTKPLMDDGNNDFLMKTLHQYFADALDTETQDRLMIEAVKRLTGVDTKALGDKSKPGWRRYLESEWLKHFQLTLAGQPGACERGSVMSSWRAFATNDDAFIPLQSVVLNFRTRSGYTHDILSSFSAEISQVASIAHWTPQGLPIFAHPNAWSAFVPTLELVDTTCSHSGFNEQANALVSPKMWEILSSEWGAPTEAVATKYEPKLPDGDGCKLAEPSYWVESQSDIWTSSLPLHLPSEIAEDVQGLSAAGEIEDAQASALASWSGWLVALNEFIPRPSPSMPMACFFIHNQLEQLPLLLSKQSSSHAPLFGLHVDKKSDEVHDRGARLAAAICSFLARASSACMAVLFTCAENDVLAKEAASCVYSLCGRQHAVLTARLQAPLAGSPSLIARSSNNFALLADQLQGMHADCQGLESVDNVVEEVYWMSCALESAIDLVQIPCVPVNETDGWNGIGTAAALEQFLYSGERPARQVPQSSSSSNRGRKACLPFLCGKG